NTDAVLQQIDIFKRGNIPVNLGEAATIKRGILSLSSEEKEDLRKYFESQKENLDLLKFVPASGAATRMFKSMYTFLDEFRPGEESLDTYLDRGEIQELVQFFNQMERLPFFDAVKALIPEYERLQTEEQAYAFVEKIDRKSTRLNSSHVKISYAVFC